MSRCRSGLISALAASLWAKGLGFSGSTHSSPFFKAFSRSFSRRSRSFSSSLVSIFFQNSFNGSFVSTRLLIESCLKYVIEPLIVSGSWSAGMSNHSASVSRPRVCGSTMTRSEGIESKSIDTISGSGEPK